MKFKPNVKNLFDHLLFVGVSRVARRTHLPCVVEQLTILSLSNMRLCQRDFEPRFGIYMLAVCMVTTITESTTPEFPLINHLNLFGSSPASLSCFLSNYSKPRLALFIRPGRRRLHTRYWLVSMSVYKGTHIYNLPNTCKPLHDQRSEV